MLHSDKTVLCRFFSGFFSPFRTGKSNFLSAWMVEKLVLYLRIKGDGSRKEVSEKFIHVHLLITTESSVTGFRH